MTQAELARAIGVSQQAVFAYEIGERRVSVLILKKIGQLFLVSMDALAGMATRGLHLRIGACRRERFATQRGS